MIPRVKISVSEDTTNYYTSSVNFVPAIILKTTTGNIGTREIVHSESEFISKFGKGTEKTPSAYALQTYLRTYTYAYVTRIADSTAIEGKATIKSGDVDLVKLTTTYKTENYNGNEVHLVYDSENKKLYLTTVINSSTVNSIKENIDLSSSETTAITLSEALDTIVKSFNAMQTALVAENLFTNKTAEDTKPEITDVFANISEGSSGLDNVTDDQVIEAMDLYATSEVEIDLLITPEFTSTKVVSEAVSKAEEYNFMYITSPNTDDINTCLSTVADYPTSESLAIYWSNVKYSGLNATIPASIAILNAYAKNDNINKWLSPAGTNRGLLSLVVDTDLNIPAILSDESLTDLYDNVIPVNPIKFVPGTGYAIWGQKTTATSDTYMDRINISRLVKYVYREVYKISSDYLFEPINNSTFTLWKLRVEALLANIQTNMGIDDYSYKMDEENNTAETIAQNQLIGSVRIKPTEVAEYIDIDFVLTSEV